MYFKRKQKIIIGVSLLVIACLLVAGAYVYIEYYASKKESPKQETVTYQLDDRISPLCKQGLILEVNRIRPRGIADALIKRGTSWRSPPQFYFNTNIDGLISSSKDIAATGNATNEQLFNTWDSMFSESKVLKDVPQEQEQTDITLTIMERIPQGILGRRYQDEERGSIEVTYDYKTGRWTGTDSMNDSDGYGHYLGDSYEVWFNLYQTDNDHDYIPYWTEVNILHTDPNISDLNLDPDGDGIPTTWEWKWGYDPFKYDNHSQLDPDRDGLTNIEEYQMEKYFANPYHQDVYLEVDNMLQENFFDEEHIFHPETAQYIIERYAQHNICFYVDFGWPDGPANGGGQFVPYYKVISQDSGMMLQFYEHYFPDERKGIFRYAIVANSAGFCHPSKFNQYDSLAISTDANLYYKFLKKAFTDRTKILAQASEIMHEVGHTMGIRHETVGGNDNFTYVQGKAQKQAFLDTWGNYKSSMNYYYFWDYSIIDYSDGSHGPGDNNDWAMIIQNMSYFKHEAKEIEQPPPSTITTVYTYLPQEGLYFDIPPRARLFPSLRQ
jgi:hypothetical protein